jgi:hypothetical protein
MILKKMANVTFVTDALQIFHPMVSRDMLTCMSVLSGSMITITTSKDKGFFSIYKCNTILSVHKPIAMEAEPKHFSRRSTKSFKGVSGKMFRDLKKKSVTDRIKRLQLDQSFWLKLDVFLNLERYMIFGIRYIVHE